MAERVRVTNWAEQEMGPYNQAAVLYDKSTLGLSDLLCYMVEDVHCEI